MGKPTLIPVTPSVLTWAMKESGYEPATVAAKVGVPPATFAAWLRGDEQPRRGALGGSAAGPPGDQPGRRRLSEWLREKLFERRIVLLTGHLDESVANETAAALMSLDAVSDQAVDLYVDSSDGTLEAAFVVIDTLGALRAIVRVHCRGQVGGAVIGIVAAGDRRSAAPHTRFRLGQPIARFSGTPEQISAQSRQQQALLWRLYVRVGQITGRPAEEIAEDMRRGRHLDAREALDYGLIEEITPAH